LIQFLTKRGTMRTSLSMYLAELRGNKRYRETHVESVFVISEGLLWGLVQLQFGRNVPTFRLNHLTSPYCISLLNIYCKTILSVICIIFVFHSTFLFLRFSMARPTHFALTAGHLLHIRVIFYSTNGSFCTRKTAYSLPVKWLILYP
jgi:hypothetical protein